MAREDMTQPITKLKVFSRGCGDRLIRVMVANPVGSDFHPFTFVETEIQGVEGLAGDRSALILHSGAEIPVALSYEDLEQKVYSPNIRTDDSSVLDLRAVTGPAAKAATTGQAAQPKTPANTNQAPEPGDKISDGTVFAGVSPDSGKALYATPADPSLTMTFNEAQKYARAANTQKLLGHNDWRVPSQAELYVLFNNRAAIGGFDISGSLPSGWYWSSSSNGRWKAWGQRFSDGLQTSHDENLRSSVRLVR